MRNKTKPDFSVPFNGDFRLLEKTLKTGRVMEVYFSSFDERSFISNNYTRSQKTDVNRLSSLCAEYGAGLNLLCNAPSLIRADLKKLFEYIKNLKNLTAVTVADPLVVSLLVKNLPGLDIQASVIMNLVTCAQIRQILELGVGTVVVGGGFHRNLSALRELAAMKKEYPKFRIKMMANYDCKADCVFQSVHYMTGMLQQMLPGGSKLSYRRSNVPIKSRVEGLEDGAGHTGKLCLHSYGPEDFIKIPFIRPEDLKFYRKHGYADCFKLIYRGTPSHILERIYDAYFSESFDGNLFDIIFTRYKNVDGIAGTGYCNNGTFPKDFIRRVTSCSKKCEKCGYCREVAVRTKCGRY